MALTAGIIVLMVGGILVAVFVFLILLMSLIYGLFRGQSGWDRLTERYACPQGPVGTLHERQTVKVGPVRWRWSMTVGLSEYGLYLCPNVPIGPLRGLVRHPPLLIPWSDLHVLGPGHIYLLWECTELAVGNPKIASLTVPNGLLALFQPYLNS